MMKRCHLAQVNDFSHFKSQNVELKQRMKEPNPSRSPTFKLQVTFYTSASYEFVPDIVKISANALLAG